MTNLELLHQQIIEAFKQNIDFVMPVKGTSMLPFINETMTVTLEKADVIKKNDIVFYKRDNGQYVLHRVFKIKNDEYVMLGDNQSAKEYGIKKHNIIAKVKHINTKNGIKELKGFKYKTYLFIWNIILLRRVLNFIRRRIHAK